MPPRGTILLQHPFRLPALALLLAATFGVRLTTAQTLIVRSAPAASTIELALDSGRVASATADKDGDATLKVPPQGAEIEAQLYVDACGALVRVLLVRLRPGPPQPGCTRSEIGSVFIVRPITTFVVDLDGTSASAHVTQGPPPREWVARGEAAAKASRNWGAPSNGLALSGGAGFSTFNRAVTVACGDTICDSSNFGLAFAATADYWFKRFIAAQASYIRPADVTAIGSGTNFRFSSALETRILTVGAKVGGAAGPARMYGIAGLNYHEATSTTSQTTDSTTVVVNGVTQTIPGGTQSYAQQVKGWNWVFGGGFELWFSRAVAFYTEVNVVKLKTSPSVGEGGLDDRALLAIAGARVHIGR
jgi:hypothetical protein